MFEICKCIKALGADDSGMHNYTLPGATSQAATIQSPHRATIPLP